MITDFRESSSAAKCRLTTRLSPELITTIPFEEVELQRYVEARNQTLCVGHDFLPNSRILLQGISSGSTNSINVIFPEMGVTPEEAVKEELSNDINEKVPATTNTLSSLTDRVTSITLCQNAGVSQSWVDTINNNLSVIPSHLLERFRSSGWSMYCTPDNIDAKWFGSQFGAVMGVTVYDYKVIYIEDRTDAVNEAPVHEFGHFLDCNLGFISDSQDFINVFNAEQAIFRSAYGVPSYFDRKELFAEAFWRYLTSNRDTFRATCPGLARILNSVTGV